MVFLPILLQKKLFPQISPSTYFVNVVAFYPCTPQPSKRENYKYKYCALDKYKYCALEMQYKFSFYISIYWEVL